MWIRGFLFVLFILSFLGAGAQSTTIHYTDADEDFVNPERGFYRYSSTDSDQDPFYDSLDVATLTGYRSLHQPYSADYSIYSSLVFRYFILSDFVSSPISATYLDQMQHDFGVARAAGVKLIPRFAYTTSPVEGDCAVDWVCPPYGDANKSQILAHIAQLKPILEANADVIAVLQMGFIGIWGEQYYTDFFGDASQNGQGYLSDQNWTDRKEVLAALLDALPTDRMVQVRYPQKKQKYAYGNAAPPDPAQSPPLQVSEAYSGSDKARMGHHNDCLLSGPDDFGTYYSYDQWPYSDTTHLKPYLEVDSRFVVVGGETCSDDYNPFNNCISAGGQAENELKRFHYSYLNADYNNEVNNDWDSVGCIESIKKHLGYRFYLESGTYTNRAQAGQTIEVSLTIRNDGYAAPFNPRGLEVILRHTNNSTQWYARLSADPRFWFGHGATHTLSETLCLPSNLPLGAYELLLNLPDPQASLYARPAYAIRLASQLSNGTDLWEAHTGYHKLGHQLTVDATSARPSCNGEFGFIQQSAYAEVCTSDLDIRSVAIPTGRYWSDGILHVEHSRVKDGTEVLLQSNTGVQIQPDFTVELGAELEVKIAPCPPN